MSRLPFYMGHIIQTMAGTQLINTNFFSLFSIENKEIRTIIQGFPCHVRILLPDPLVWVYIASFSLEIGKNHVVFPFIFFASFFFRLGFSLHFLKIGIIIYLWSLIHKYNGTNRYRKGAGLRSYLYWSKRSLRTPQ